ncbi:hypothetical protein [Brevundimonas sp.]|uniref:hypothetical protein n=1 Tax=Brevundimonas sp. TaxID=1871086 RepID=UPI003F730D06
MKELLPYFSLAIAVIACALSAWTAVRAGRWRNSEAHAALLGRVGSLESWKTLTDQKLTGIESDLSELPTAADLARLEGEIKRTISIAERTEKAVDRLHGYLMERGS